MPESKPIKSKRPEPPYLVSPQEEAVMDGDKVVFIWEPVEKATAYRLEVASDTVFNDIVYEETTTATTVSVSEIFPTDGTTFFWRVFATNEAGESRGENIESFISHTAEEAARHIIRPDHKERLGPVTELVTGGSEDMLHLRRKEGTPRDVTIDVPEQTGSEEFHMAEDHAGVQHEGIEARQILVFIFFLLVTIGVIVWGGINWARTVARQTYDNVASQIDYPELRQVELEAARQLSQYEVVNAEQGVYRVPIDRAIDLIVNEAAQTPAANYSQELHLPGGN